MCTSVLSSSASSTADLSPRLQADDGLMSGEPTSELRRKRTSGRSSEDGTALAAGAHAHVDAAERPPLIDHRSFPRP